MAGARNPSLGALLALSPHEEGKTRPSATRRLATRTRGRTVPLRNPSPQAGKTPRRRLVGGRPGSHSARGAVLAPSPWPDFWLLRDVFPSDASTACSEGISPRNHPSARQSAAFRK